MDEIEKQRRLLYAIVVAGKSANFTNAVMRRFAGCRLSDEEKPFDMIKRLDGMHALGQVLREIRCGNYGKIEQAFRGVANANLNLDTCTPLELEAIHGIGPKTARFFIIWIRPTERYAALDVHILRWLRNQGIDAPKSTPSGAKYAELEKKYLEICDSLGKTPREIDEAVWSAGSGYSENVA